MPMAIVHMPFRSRRIWLAIIAIPVILTGCGNAEATLPTPGANADAVTSGAEQPDWTVVSNGLNVVLATPDLGLGEQRFAMVLSTREGLVRFPVVEFRSYFYPEGLDGRREGPFQTELARFTEFPLGTRGIYVTSLEFNRQGSWSVEVDVPQSDGSSASAEVQFAVNESPHSVAVGEKAPLSRNRTLSDVASVRDLTTGSLYDEELYRLTIAEAVSRQQPLVVVFASPAFCTNAVCGPQVEVASELRARYAGQVNFIHVDLFENPREIQGDLNRAVETPLLREWGLVSQEWTYVLDSSGAVTARFENFVGVEELTEAIDRAIATG